MVTFVNVLVVLGFPIAVIMGCMFDLGPRGAERTIEIPAEADPGDATLTGSAAIADPLPAPGMPLAAPGAERHTIAVLPFVNMSGDAENEYFSDGISEEILNLLAKLPQLKVASRTSSFVFKGKETRSEEHTSELQSLMRISYAVFCLKHKTET